MIRARRFRRPMSRLALLAVLLLALVPTLGRLARTAGDGAAGVAPAWAAMCTARGLEAVLLPPAAHPATQVEGHGIGEAPALPHGNGNGGDCDYCPLLASAIPVPAAPPAIAPSALPAPALCTSRPSLAHAEPHPCGLGSRGPPTFS